MVDKSDCPMRDGDNLVAWVTAEIIRVLTPLSANERRAAFDAACEQCGIDPATVHAEQEVKG